MDAFIGEIRIFPFNYAPKAWAFCNGQTMTIQQNTALFSILGAYFGGNGSTNFMLPNIPGQAVVHAGQGTGLSAYAVGQTGGTETVTLTASQAPNHTHSLLGNTRPADSNSPTGHSTVGRTSTNFYQSSSTNLASMSASSLQSVGSGGAHNNLQPYLAMNFCIALQGEYPPRP